MGIFDGFNFDSASAGSVQVDTGSVDAAVPESYSYNDYGDFGENGTSGMNFSDTFSPTTYSALADVGGGDKTWWDSATEKVNGWMFGDGTTDKKGKESTGMFGDMTAKEGRGLLFGALGPGAASYMKARQDEKTRESNEKMARDRINQTYALKAIPKPGAVTTTKMK